MKPRFLFSPDGGDGGGGGDGTLLSGGDPAPTPSPTPNPTPTPGAEWDFRSALDDKGAFKQGWVDTLPPDLKDYASTLGKYPNVAELLRGHGNAQKLIGQKGAQGIKPPGPDAKPEEIAAFRKALGVPDDVAGYDIKKPENLPEGVEWNDEDVNGFKKLAHDIGLTPAQAAKLVEYDTARMGAKAVKGKEGLDAFVAGQRDALTKEWGDGYDSKIQAAKLFAQEASDYLKVDLLKSGYANDATFIRLAEYAYQCSKDARKEDKFVASNKVGLGLTGADQAEDIRRNPANPWHAAYNGKEGKERQAQAQALMMRLNGVKDATV